MLYRKRVVFVLSNIAKHHLRQSRNLIPLFVANKGIRAQEREPSAVTKGIRLVGVPVNYRARKTLNLHIDRLVRE